MEDKDLNSGESPISGSWVPTVKHDHFLFFHEAFGKWGCIEDLPRRTKLKYDNPYSFKDNKLDAAQASKAIALLKTKVWLSNRTNRRPLFLHLETIIDDEGYEKASQITREIEAEPTDMGRLYSEVSVLSFQSRAYYTLYNLSLACPPGQFVLVPFDLSEYPGYKYDNIDMLMGGHVNDGLIYATPDNEGPVLIQYLQNQNFINIKKNPSGKGWGIGLTPEGYAIAAQMVHGQVTKAPKAFCVSRFLPRLDKVYEEVYRPIGDDLGCPVHRVDRIPHNEVITDRILREIREATVVVVDMTESNFNVGFEAGYAMHLNKQIIFTIFKAAEDVKLPFDVAGYSTIIYDDLDDLKDKFRERMIVSINLEKAKGQLPELPN